MIDSLGRETRAIQKAIADLMVYSSSLTYDDAWAMGHSDRNLLASAMNNKARKENPDGKEYM